MKNLFIVDGASGAGKFEMVKYVSEFKNDCSYVQKYTTRKTRNYEKNARLILDLIFVDDDTKFQEMKFDYKYRYAGNMYGVYKKDILAAMSMSNNVFIIIRNYEVINSLAHDFSYVNVIPLFVHTCDNVIEKWMKEKKDITPEQINEALDRNLLAYADYHKKPNIYKEIIINNSDKKDLFTTCDKLLEKYYYSSCIDDKLIFIFMSFRSENKHMLDYLESMKRAVKKIDSSYRCINLEDIHGSSYKISEEAISNMIRCRLAIVDLSDARPDVYYELGYLHAIKKKTIITAIDGTNLPFYPKEFKVVFTKMQLICRRS